MSFLQRSMRLDLLLVLCAVALGGYLAATAGAPTSAELNARARNVFPAFEPETIQTIHLESPESSVTLKRDLNNPDPELYFLGEKSSLLADPESVSELLSTLDFASWIRRLPSAESNDLKKLGFETPRLELKLQAGPRSARLLLGSPAPHPEESIYARFEQTGDEPTTGVVSSSLLTRLLRGEQEFRGSSLFAYSRSDTTNLTIESKQSSLKLAADSLGFLVSSSESNSGPGRRAKASLVELVFYQLARAKLSPFLDEATAKTGILADPSRLTIRQQANNSPAVEVVLGGQCPGDPLSILAWRTKPNVVTGCVTSSILAILRAAPSTFIDQTAAPLAADEIDHVIIKRSDSEKAGKIDLIRRDAAFVLLNRNSQEVELQAGQDFLEVLSSGVLSLLPERPKNTREVGELTIKGQSQATGAISATGTSSSSDEADALVQELHLEIHRSDVESDSHLFVHRLDDGAWLTVPPELAWAFSTNDYWAQSRHLSHWKSEDILTFSVRSPALEHTLKQDDGEITVSYPRKPTEPADAALARVLLEEFERLEALRFDSATADTPNRPREKFELLIEFQLKNEAAPQRLWVGRRTRGGYLAEATFHDGLFVLSPAMRRLFETPLASRQALRFDSQKIEALDLNADGRHYSFRRRAGELSPTGGAAVQEMVAPIEESISRIEVLARRMQASKRSQREVRLTMKVALEGSESRTVYIAGGDEWQGKSVTRAWLDGVDGEFLLSRAGAEALLDLL